MIASITMTIFSELAFTLYVHAYGLPNFFGHIFKIVSFYLIYKAFIEAGLRRTNNLIFRELKHSEERFRDIILSTSDWLWEVDTQGRYTFCSERVKDILGYTIDEMIGKTPFEFMPPDEAAKIGKIFEEFSRNLAPIVNLESWNINREGKMVCLLTNGAPVFDERGNFTVYRGVNKDITNRKIAQDEISFQANLLHNVSDAIISTDLERQITSWNNAAEHVYGWNKNEVIGKNIDDVCETEFPGETQIEVQKQLLCEGYWKGGIIQKRKNRETIHILTAISWIRDSDGNPIGEVTVNHDITERVQTEQENVRLLAQVQDGNTRLRVLSQKLVQAQEEERKRISQELHDDIGQALTAMSFNLAAIDAELLPSETAQVRKRFIETERLIEQTLQYTRDLTHSLHPSMLDDLGLIPTLRWYTDQFSDRMNIEVRLEVYDIRERLPTDIETVIYRIVVEILTNVARHAQAKLVIVILEYSEDGVTIVIEDDGVGFDVMALEMLEPEKRGMGLLGIQERVAILGGNTSIQSSPKMGTHIIVKIPLEVDDDSDQDSIS